MERLPGSTAVARGLLALHRAGASGVVTIAGSGGIARLLVIEGTARAIEIPGEDDSLGEILARGGELDLAVHGRALAVEEPSGPIGRWLVHHGATTEAAVERALRAQLRQRMLRLFRWHDVELSFSASASWTGVPALELQIAPTDLVLEALLEAAESVSPDDIRQRLGSGRLVLTRIGEAIASHARLGARDARLLHRLQQGASVDELLDEDDAATASSRRQASCFLLTLKTLGAIDRPSAAGRSYQALIRKQRQLRGLAQGASLLDLPDRASARDARRSLQRIARDLHPDRFPEPALRRASNEVLSRLVQAQLSLDKT